MSMNDLPSHSGLFKMYRNSGAIVQQAQYVALTHPPHPHMYVPQRRVHSHNHPHLHPPTHLPTQLTVVGWYQPFSSLSSSETSLPPPGLRLATNTEKAIHHKTTISLSLQYLLNNVQSITLFKCQFIFLLVEHTTTIMRRVGKQAQ